MISELEEFKKASQIACISLQNPLQSEEELHKILAWINQLDEVDTDGVEPLVTLSQEKNVLREDIPARNLTHQQALDNAAYKDTDYFRVPQVLKPA